jgi:hypothetical protein
MLCDAVFERVCCVKLPVMLSVILCDALFERDVPNQSQPRLAEHMPKSTVSIPYYQMKLNQNLSRRHPCDVNWWNKSLIKSRSEQMSTVPGVPQHVFDRPNNPQRSLTSPYSQHGQTRHVRSWFPVFVCSVCSLALSVRQVFVPGYYKGVASVTRVSKARYKLGRYEGGP